MAKAHAIITALVNDPDKDLSELIPPKTLPTLASKSAKVPVKTTVASSLPVTLFFIYLPEEAEMLIKGLL